MHIRTVQASTNTCVYPCWPAGATREGMMSLPRPQLPSFVKHFVLRQTLRCAPKVQHQQMCSSVLLWGYSEMQQMCNMLKQQKLCWRLVHLYNFQKVSPSHHFLFRYKDAFIMDMDENCISSVSTLLIKSCVSRKTRFISCPKPKRIVVAPPVDSRKQAPDVQTILCPFQLPHFKLVPQTALAHALKCWKWHLWKSFCCCCPTNLCKKCQV